MFVGINKCYWGVIQLIILMNNIKIRDIEKEINIKF